MKRIKKILLTLFVVAFVLSLGSCPDGSGGGNDLWDLYLRSLTSGEPSNTAKIQVGLNGKDLSGIRAVSGYRGWEYYSDTYNGDYELTMIWTNQTMAGYNIIKSQLETILGVTFSIYLDPPSYLWEDASYGSGNYECNLVFTKTEVDLGSYKEPAGVIELYFRN